MDQPSSQPLAVALPPSLTARTRGRCRVPAPGAAGQAQCARRRNDPRFRGVLRKPARAGEGGGAARRGRAFLRRPRSRRAAPSVTSVEGIAHSRMWHRVFDRIQFGRVPVVAVLHGAVIGGGLELAASTHVRVAERSTFYALARRPARHLCRRRRLGAHAAADRRRAHDGHDADRPRLWRRRRSANRDLAIPGGSRRRPGQSGRSWRARSPAMRR